MKAEYERSDSSTTVDQATNLAESGRHCVAGWAVGKEQPAGMHGRAAVHGQAERAGPLRRKRMTALVGGRVVMAGADASEQVNQEARRPPPGIGPTQRAPAAQGCSSVAYGRWDAPPTHHSQAEDGAVDELVAPPPPTARPRAAARRHAFHLAGRQVAAQQALICSTGELHCTGGRRAGGRGLGAAFPGARIPRQGDGHAPASCLPVAGHLLPLPTLAAVPLAALPVGLRGAAWHAQRAQERTAPQAPHDDSGARSSASKACHQRAARHVPNTAGMEERRPQAAQLTVEHARVMQQLVEILLGKGRGAGDETAQRPAVCARRRGTAHVCLGRRAACRRVDLATPIPAQGASARWRPPDQTAADHSAQQATQQQRASAQHPQGGERHL